MNNKKNIEKTNYENADKICAKVREASAVEAELILEKAHKERARILSEASTESQARVRSILSLSENEIAGKKDKIFSTVVMEKRKILLEAKGAFVSDVMNAVNEESGKFRNNPGYVKFLKDAIAEGIKIINDKKAKVFYSHLDEDIVSQIKDLPVKFYKSDFDDIGVIIQSDDDRLLFDNRFSARLKRAYDDIYAKLIKEVF